MYANIEIPITIILFNLLYLLAFDIELTINAVTMAMKAAIANNR